MCLCVRELNACEFLERQKCSDIVGSVRESVCVSVSVSVSVCVYTHS